MRARGALVRARTNAPLVRTLAPLFSVRAYIIEMIGLMKRFKLGWRIGTQGFLTLLHIGNQNVPPGDNLNNENMRE